MNMVVSHWSANVAVIAACLVIAAVHFAGLRAMARDGRRDGAVPAGPGPAGRGLPAGGLPVRGLPVRGLPAGGRLSSGGK
jgi:hypothetical protein